MKEAKANLDKTISANKQAYEQLKQESTQNLQQQIVLDQQHQEKELTSQKQLTQSMIRAAVDLYKQNSQENLNQQESKIKSLEEKVKLDEVLKTQKV